MMKIKVMQRRTEPVSPVKIFKKGVDYSQDLLYGQLGFSKAKQAWSKKMGVDPYSKNKVLQKAISDVSWVSAAGSIGAKIAVPSLPDVYDYIEETNDLVWSLDSLDLKMRNIDILKKMGMSEGVIDMYFSTTDS